MRNTPKRVRSSGALRAAASDSARHAPRVLRVDDAIVPQPRGRVVRVSLALVLLADRRLEGLLLGGRPVPACGLQLVALDGGEHARGLLAAHDRDARIGPLKQEARRIGAAAHGVVARAVAAADDHGELRHRRAGHRGHELRAVLGDAAGLRAPPDHEAGDVLQEQQRNLLARAQLDEVRALEGALGEQHAVVGEDPDRVAPQVRKAAHERRAVELLELVQLRVIDQPRDHLAHVVGLAQARRQHAVELRPDRRRGSRAARGGAVAGGGRRCADDAARDRQRVGVVLGVVIAHA